MMNILSPPEITEGEAALYQSLSLEASTWNGILRFCSVNFQLNNDYKFDLPVLNITV